MYLLTKRQIVKYISRKDEFTHRCVLAAEAPNDLYVVYVASTKSFYYHPVYIYDCVVGSWFGCSSEDVIVDDTMPYLGRGRRLVQGYVALTKPDADIQWCDRSDLVSILIFKGYANYCKERLI